MQHVCCVLALRSTPVELCSFVLMVVCVRCCAPFLVLFAMAVLA